MDSVTDPPCGGGCPIRKSSDQSLLAAPQGLSQRATSFIASRRQGIHQMPFSHSPRPSGKSRAEAGDQRSEPIHDPRPPASVRPPTGAKQAYPCWAPPSASKKERGGQRHPCQSAGRQGTSPGRPVAHHHHTMSRVKERLPPLRQPTGSSTRSGCPKLHPSPHPSSCLPRRGGSSGRAWWARADLNGRPHAYQACALTS